MANKGKQRQQRMTEQDQRDQSKQRPEILVAQGCFYAKPLTEKLLGEKG